eukprot:1136464-Pelagomonas_calceolata.AAC.6
MHACAHRPADCLIIDKADAIGQPRACVYAQARRLFGYALAKVKALKQQLLSKVQGSHFPGFEASSGEPKGGHGLAKVQASHPLQQAQQQQQQQQQALLDADAVCSVLNDVWVTVFGRLLKLTAAAAEAAAAQQAGTADARAHHLQLQQQQQQQQQQHFQQQQRRQRPPSHSHKTGQDVGTHHIQQQQQQQKHHHHHHHHQGPHEDHVHAPPVLQPHSNTDPSPAGSITLLPPSPPAQPFASLTHGDSSSRQPQPQQPPQHSQAAWCPQPDPLLCPHDMTSAWPHQHSQDAQPRQLPQACEQGQGAWWELGQHDRRMKQPQPGLPHVHHPSDRDVVPQPDQDLHHHPHAHQQQQGEWLLSGEHPRQQHHHQQCQEKQVDWTQYDGHPQPQHQLLRQQTNNRQPPTPTPISNLDSYGNHALGSGKEQLKADSPSLPSTAPPLGVARPPEASATPHSLLKDSLLAQLMTEAGVPAMCSVLHDCGSPPLIARSVTRRARGEHVELQVYMRRAQCKRPFRASYSM